MAEQTIEAMLKQLELERARLDIVIAALRVQLGQPANAESSIALTTLLGTSAPSALGATPGSIRPDEFFQMSIPEAIKRYLSIMKSPQQPKAITTALKSGGLLTNARDFSSTIWTALSRLKEQGEITNIAGQGWGLSEWYKGRLGSAAKETKPARKITGGAARKGLKKNSNVRTKPSSPRLALPPGERKHNWNSFLAEQARAGRTMKEASAAWKELKQQQG